MKRLLEPKPLRAKAAWKQLTIMLAADLTAIGKEKMNAAAKVTCRDCFGFGHTQKKCPTGKKFDEHREANSLLRTIISRARAKLSNNIVVHADDATWFFVKSATEDLGTVTMAGAAADKNYVQNFV